MTIRGQSFQHRERERQTLWFRKNFPTQIGFKGSDFRLQPEYKILNVLSDVREQVEAYFGKTISWHTHSNHALSSQVCCLNFLAPLARRPEILSRLIGTALKIEPPEMVEVEEGPSGEPWFVGFEWIGGDYLNETGKSGKRTRGANATSADAIVKFRHAGRQDTLLIEWKYTEKYGQPIRPDGNAVRTSRYERMVFEPDGPVKAGIDIVLSDFFFEPFYQNLRQQMLAWQMQKHGEDGADRVRVLYISPAANIAIKAVTAPKLRNFGDTAPSAFTNILANPDDFIACSTEALFYPLLTSHRGAAWAEYLLERYTFISDLPMKEQ